MHSLICLALSLVCYFFDNHHNATLHGIQAAFAMFFAVFAVVLGWKHLSMVFGDEDYHSHVWIGGFLLFVGTIVYLIWLSIRFFSVHIGILFT